MMNKQKSEVQNQAARAVRELAMLLLLRRSPRWSVTSPHSRRQPRKDAVGGEGGGEIGFARGQWYKQKLYRKLKNRHLFFLVIKNENS